MCETSTTEERRRKEEAEAAGAELKIKGPDNPTCVALCVRKTRV